MKKIVYLIFCIAFLVLPMVGATNTTLLVHTMNGYNFSVTLNFIDLNTGNLIQTLQDYTANNGDFTGTYTGGENVADIYIIVRNDGRIVVNKDFGNYSLLSGIIELNAFGLSNTTINNSVISLNNSTNSTLNQTNITSNVSHVNQTNNFNFSNITQPLKKFGLWIVYLIGAIIVLGLVFFVIKMILPKFKNIGRRQKEDIRVLPNPKLEKELAQAERKIKEAQETIDNITGRKRKLAEAESRFEQAKRDLDRLKRGF
jgi:hypothetical protein